MIYHYDLLAEEDIIRGNAEPTRARQSVDAKFKDLGFGYKEAPCPQQDDSSSCGLMVIRNAALRMNGCEVGGWDGKLNPEQLRMDLIDLFRTALESKQLAADNSFA
ncbi:hypothetical protein F5X98DRAFT_359235 [Xylaria grammica]|nr:hypothetical protein F5X98DRAFT_359235 [Xylaria grammica]